VTRRACVVVTAGALVVLATSCDVESRCGKGGPMGDYAFSQETLRDWVSYFDQLSVVRAVSERTAGRLDDSSGVVGRRVAVVVERTLWRRPHAPRAPRRFSFTDFPWSRDDEEGSLEPTVFCGETRMEVGSRYLAIVGHWRGEWFPAGTGRLVLEGERAVGGVDDGEPSRAHSALMGMTIAAAAEKVAATEPYRAAVANARLGPVARERAVIDDGHRVSRPPRGGAAARRR
jgi:hypothetical protein